MAKTIATIGGIALAPGVSKNRRLYTPDHVKSAVARAQKRIKSGDRPMVMLTHHGAGDDSRQIAASLTSVSLDEAGRARYTAAISDTEAGRDIASLVDTSDDQPPHLDGVSIRGAWLGTVRKVRGPDGEAVETADDLEWDGLDFTRSPGVDAASIDTFAWAGKSGATETTERVLITESVQEARVTISEETAPAPPQVPEGVGEALRAFLGAPPVEEAGTPSMSKRDSGLSGSGRVWADPGYQADHKQRYDITTKNLAKTAWSYINQKAKAAKYTPAQLKRVKARIIKALKSFGVTVSATEAAGWMFEEPFQVSESVLEWMGDGPERSGSWCITAGNGPVSLSLSSYCMDPADLGIILRAAADAACKALAALDPDMDGDVDVPGAGDGSDADDDAPGESAPPEQVTETDPDPAPVPDAVPQTDKEVPAMADTATPAVEASPAAAADPKAVAEAVEAALAKRDADRKAAKKAARKAAEKAARPAESAAAAPVTETADERIARLVEEGVTKRLAEEGALPVTETEDQRVARLVEEGVTKAKQQLVASGQAVPGRKGLAPSGEVNEHTARVTPEGDMPPAPPGKSWDEMHKWSTEEMNQYATPGLADYVFNGRAGSIG